MSTVRDIILGNFEANLRQFAEEKWNFLHKVVHSCLFLILINLVTDIEIYTDTVLMPPCGVGAPLFSPCPFTSSSFPLLLLSFFHWLYLFSSFVHPFPFYQNSPTPLPGRRL